MELHVTIQLDGTDVPCGTLYTTVRRGQQSASFTYDRSYILRKDAFERREVPKLRSRLRRAACRAADGVQARGVARWTRGSGRRPKKPFAGRRASPSRRSVASWRRMRWMAWRAVVPPYTFRRSRRKKWPSRVHSLPPNELCEQAVLGYELVVRATLCDSSVIEDQYPVAMSDGR